VAYFLVFKEHLRNLGVQAGSFSPKAYREKERLYLNSITSVYHNIEFTTRIIYYPIFNSVLKYRIAFSKR